MSFNDIPKDPAMLLSFVNTGLRDKYCDLVEFCHANNVDINDINGRLRSINYIYDSEKNQFV